MVGPMREIARDFRGSGLTKPDQEPPASALPWGEEEYIANISGTMVLFSVPCSLKYP